MLSHCANSQCLKPFLRLREGRLFLVERPSTTQARSSRPSVRKPPQQVEHFWLCDQCASVWTLIQNGTRGIALVPLAQPAVAACELPEKSHSKAT
jgi:hypothetical protein